MSKILIYKTVSFRGLGSCAYLGQLVSCCANFIWHILLWCNDCIFSRLQSEKKQQLAECTLEEELCFSKLKDLVAMRWVDKNHKWFSEAMAKMHAETGTEIWEFFITFLSTIWIIKQKCMQFLQSQDTQKAILYGNHTLDKNMK